MTPRNKPQPLTKEEAAKEIEQIAQAMADLNRRIDRLFVVVDVDLEGRLHAINETPQDCQLDLGGPANDLSDLARDLRECIDGPEDEGDTA